MAAKPISQPFVFVIMPFAKEWDDSYKLGIKAACEDAGATCARVDEQIFLENILQRIYNQIEKADIVVAEMTGRSPNVFYEVGYAKGVRKKVILLTRSVDDIPFDLRHYPHIVHGGSISTLKEELTRKLRWVIDHPDDAPMGRPARTSSTPNDFNRMAKHILNYLRANEFTMVSFDRIRKNIDPAYSDELLLELINVKPGVFRRARLKGGTAGLATIK